MALIECYECKGKVSSEVKVCPHCGVPIEVKIVYHENGQMRMRIFLKDGKAYGLMTVWYENGQKSYEGNYKDGKEDGLWIYYNEDGTESHRHKDGEPVFD